MKAKKLMAVLLVIAMLATMFTGMTLTADAETLDEMQDDIILDLNFDSADLGLDGTTTIGEGVTFVTDAGGNTVVRYDGRDDDTQGIVYTPAAGADPMAAVTAESGVTISMWIKTSLETFNNTLFVYGAQKSSEPGALGAAAQIIGRNDTANNHEEVYYRDNNGSTGGQKLNIPNGSFVKDTWQLVTYTELNGSMALYIDGDLKGTLNGGKKIHDYAADTYQDAYYIACNSKDEGGDKLFNGDIDSVTVYKRALTADEVALLYTDAPAEAPELPDYLDFEVAEAKAANDITWNTALTVKGTDMDTLNQEAVFLDYGAYYGVTQEAVDAAAASGADVYEGEGENAKLIATSKSFVPEDNTAEDVNVYTVIGFRLKNVAADAERFAKIYVTYKIGDTTYTEFSDGTTVIVE